MELGIWVTLTLQDKYVEILKLNRDKSTLSYCAPSYAATDDEIVTIVP